MGGETQLPAILAFSKLAASLPLELYRLICQRYWQKHLKRESFLETEFQSRKVNFHVGPETFTQLGCWRTQS